MDDVTCRECGTEDWDFIAPGLAQCANGHEWDQAADPAFPGTFVRPGFPGDVNDPDRYPAGEEVGDDEGAGEYRAGAAQTPRSPGAPDATLKARDEAVETK